MTDPDLSWFYGATDLPIDELDRTDPTEEEHDEQ